MSQITFIFSVHVMLQFQGNTWLPNKEDLTCRYQNTTGLLGSIITISFCIQYIKSNVYTTLHTYIRIRVYKLIFIF